VGDVDATGEGFELTEGGAGFGEVSAAEVDAGEDAAEGVGGGVAGVDEDAGAAGYVAEAEFLKAVTGAVVEFEPVGGKGDGGVGGVVEGVFGRIVGRFKGADAELVAIEDGADGAVGVKFFADEDEGVEVVLHGVKVLRVWADSFYRLFVCRRRCVVSGRSSVRFPGWRCWGRRGSRSSGGSSRCVFSWL